MSADLLDLDPGSIDDRQWFARRHGRNYRLRNPIGGEALFVRLPPGFKPMVVVRQVEPGSRLRIPFGWRICAPRPLNAESVAERLWLANVEGRDVTILDRSR